MYEHLQLRSRGGNTGMAIMATDMANMATGMATMATALLTLRPVYTNLYISPDHAYVVVLNILFSKLF